MELSNETQGHTQPRSTLTRFQSEQPHNYEEFLELFSDVLSEFPKLKLPKVNDELYYFDPIAAYSACAFFESELYHTEDPFAGQPLVLEPWQVYVVAAIYGWKRKTFSDDGKWINTPEQIEQDVRKFREVFIFIAKKNGKTFLTGGFALKGMVADNEVGANVVSAAGDKPQAALVFKVAKNIVEINPRLSADVQTYKNSMVCYSMASNFIVLSADAKTKHGPSLSTVIVDEVHVQPDRELMDTLFAGVAVRRQPLKIMLTTAGHDRQSVCYEYYDYAKKVQEGIIYDEEFFPVIFELEEGDDWKDEKNWIKANPNLGKTFSIDFLRSEFKKAIEKPSYENTFKRLHLNQWTQQNTRWLPIELWEACNEPLLLGDLSGKLCYAGLDLSSKIDLTAFILVFLLEKKVHIVSRFWMPEDNIAVRKKRDRVDYEVWVKQGFITATPGNVMDYDYIRKDINNDAQKYNIKEIGADPWAAQDLLVKLDNDGLNTVEVTQNFNAQADATSKMEELVMARRFVHGNNPVLKWMFGNVTIARNSEGKIRPSKRKSKEKIDGIIALVNALSRMLANDDERGSIYETQGVMTL